MKRLSALLLSLFSSLASADAPLFIDHAPPQWRYEDSALSDRLKVAPGVKKVIPLTLNRAALQGDAITVAVNNKTYRFVGKATSYPATPQAMTWSGIDAAVKRREISPSAPTSSTGLHVVLSGPISNRLSISVADDAEGGVYGTLGVDGLHFTIHGTRGASTVFLVERGPSGLSLKD